MKFQVQYDKPFWIKFDYFCTLKICTIILPSYCVNNSFYALMLVQLGWRMECTTVLVISIIFLYYTVSSHGCPCVSFVKIYAQKWCFTVVLI